MFANHVRPSDGFGEGRRQAGALPFFWGGNFADGRAAMHHTRWRHRNTCIYEILPVAVISGRFFETGKRAGSDQSSGRTMGACQWPAVIFKLPARTRTLPSR